MSNNILAKNEDGVVFIDFIFLLIPFMTIILGLCQLALLYLGSLAVQRSAATAARAAMVVLDDDPKYYDGQARNTLGGKRQEDIELAASFPLYALKTSPPFRDDLEHTFRAWKTSPYRMNLDVASGLEVSFPRLGTSAGRPTKVRIRYEFTCEVPLVRSLLCDAGKRTLEAEATLPNHAAKYTYGQW